MNRIRRASRLRHKVDIMMLAPIKNDVGTVADELTPFREGVRAYCEVSKVDESSANDGYHNTVWLNVEMRYHPDVSTKMFVRWKGVDYPIKGIIPDETSSDMQLVCELKRV